MVCCTFGIYHHIAIDNVDISNGLHVTISKH